MAVLLTFELSASHLAVRERLLSEGFLNSMVGYHTQYSDEMIQSDLPSTLLFHPSYSGAEALRHLRDTASSYGIRIDDEGQRAFAIEIAESGAVGWRGVISRFHPKDEY